MKKLFSVDSYFSQSVQNLILKPKSEKHDCPKDNVSYDYGFNYSYFEGEEVEMVFDYDYVAGSPFSVNRKSAICKGSKDTKKNWRQTVAMELTSTGHNEFKPVLTSY